MLKATESSVHGNNLFSQADEMVPCSLEEFSSSEQEPDPEVSFHQFKPPQLVSNMFMSYIEGPKRDWTVNDGLYHRFFKLVLEVWEYPRVQACSFAWVTTMQESDCLEQRLWHGPICVRVLVCRGAQFRYNLGKVWGVLQAKVTPGPNNTIHSIVYQKPTHTDQYLHWDSNHFIVL